MKEKKIHQKIQREREREGTFFFVRENYAQNERDSKKFIVKECEYIRRDKNKRR